jgi:hypothetical protein
VSHAGFITHRYPDGQVQIEAIKDGLKVKIKATTEQFELLRESKKRKRTLPSTEEELKREKLATSIFSSAVTQELM